VETKRSGVLILTSILVTLVVFASYLICLSPTITSDDSGELSGVTATLGIAHSPGYPLYSIIGKIFQTIFPLGNPAYRANILSALTSAAGAGLAVYFFSKISYSLTAGMVCALALGLSPFLYDTATETEVYGVVIFFMVLLLNILVSKNISTRKKSFLASYISGLAVISHYTFILWVPAILWQMWWILKKENQKISVGVIVSCIGFFLIGLSPVIFIYLRAQGQPLYSWEDPQTLKRFWQVVSRARYGGAGYLAQGEMNIWEPSLWIEKIKFLTGAIQNNFSIAGLITGLTGIFITFLPSRKESSVTSGNKIFLLLLLIGGGPGFLIMANVSVGNPSAESLLSRFLYMLAISWCGYIAIGLGRLQKTSKTLVLIVGGFILLWLAHKSFAENKTRRYHFTFYDYATNIIKNTPPNTILISDRADEMEFCVSYLIRIAGKRQDIQFIDGNAGITKSIYGDNYYKIWGKPRLEIRNRVEADIIRKAIISPKSQPVFYATFLPEQTTTPKTPWGLLYYSANFNPTHSFADEIFAIRPPENELRSISLYNNHYFMLGDYYSVISDENRMMKNYSAVFYGVSDDNFYRHQTMAYHKAGFYFYNKQKYDEARRIYETIIKFYPSDVDALLNLGVISEKTSDITSAEAYYTKAIEISSGRKDADSISKQAMAYYNLGVLYWKKNNHQKARDMFEKAYRLEPENPTYKYYAEKFKVQNPNVK